ncbi:MAG: hypothetical protein JSR59_13825 [Proteobacteria bacterium]|nr:hypothetical protein [Pseudomonadota bacterium]
MIRINGMVALCTAAILMAPAMSRAAEPAVLGPDGQPLDNHTAVRADPPGGVHGPTPLHPNAQAALERPFAGTGIDVTTFHYDALRTGWNQAETVLTPANVASSNFGLLTTLNVDGNVLAQPLLVSRFPFPASGGNPAAFHDVLVVATGHNSVYAYDAQNYALLWQRNLGPAQQSADVGCGDVIPETGISSTPVIVRESATKASIYLIAATEPTTGTFRNTIHRLSLTDGGDVVAPVDLAPTAQMSDGTTIGFDAKNQWSRAALAWGSNSVYVGIGSHCDNNAGNITGWMLRYAPSLQLQAAFNTVDDPAGYKLSSVWGSGFGPAINAAGRVYAVTGNGDFDANQGGRNYGESVLALSASLGNALSTFTPGNYNSLNDEDADFGSGGVMLLPSLGATVPPLALAIGKDSVLYLLNQNRLGGYSLSNAGALQKLRISSPGAGTWGGPAYYNSTATGPLVYVQTANAVLHSYAVSAATKPALTAAASGTSTGGWGGSMPIVSSNGTTPGTGVVWLVRRVTNPQLEAYDAASLGAPIYQATAGTWSNSRNNAYLTAMQANGRVYVGTYKTVTVFGLAP